MKRRSALQLGGSMLLTALAGCSLSDSLAPAEVTVSEITIRNRLERAVEVSVLLTASDEIVLWRTVTVPTAPNQFVTFDDLPAEPRKYTLYAQVPTSDTDDPIQADLVEDAGDQSCLEVRLEITSNPQNDRSEPTLVYGSIGQCNR
ncbi:MULTISPECIES: hypothetical protein [Salinibaculum]|uniref:hypothetical protein n=1 Tax=Salinibaculum TaxID=2732368 RepID=UPI0030D5456B